MPKGKELIVKKYIVFSVLVLVLVVLSVILLPAVTQASGNAVPTPVCSYGVYNVNTGKMYCTTTATPVVRLVRPVVTATPRVHLVRPVATATPVHRKFAGGVDCSTWQQRLLHFRSCASLSPWYIGR